MDSTRYPRGKNDQQCIGPCYKANKWIIHPITLDYVTNENVPFCPTNIWGDGDAELKIDECNFVTGEDDQVALEMNILMPNISFGPEMFLKIYYKIYSFENAIAWIELNKHVPLFTRIRVMDSAWRAYGRSVDVITDAVVQLYIEMIRKNWIRYLYPFIAEYIIVKNGKIAFGKNGGETHKVEKINFFLKKIVNENLVYKFLVMYVEKFSDEWDQIETHNENMRAFFAEYVIAKLDRQ